MYPPDPTVINIACRRAFSTTPKRQKTHYGIPSASRRYFGPLPALQHGLPSPSRLRCGRSRQYGAHLAAPSRWELPGWVRTAAAADVDSPPVGAHSAADLPASPRLQHRPRRRRIVIRFIVRSVNTSERQSLLRKSILGGLVARRALHSTAIAWTASIHSATHVHTLTLIDSLPSCTSVT